MAKSQGRFLAELLGSDGKVEKAKSDAGIYAGANVTIAADGTLTTTTLPLAGGALTGAVTTNSTFDGRDVAADGVTADAALPKAGGAMTGAITTNSTFDGVDIATRDAILTSTTTTAGAALPKAGGAMTGAITTNSTFDGVDIATRDAILTSTTTTANAALPKAGGAMTGAITTNSTFDGVDIATRDAILTSTTTTANAALPKAGGTVTGNLRSASFSVGAADSGEALNILDGGHTGHGATNTVSLASFAENVSGNSSGPWLGSMTTENTAVIGSRTASGNIGFQTYSGGWGERMRITSAGNVGIGTATPGSNHAKANNLVVGSGSAGGMAVFNGTAEGWYAFSRSNANNTDAYDGGMSYTDRVLRFHTNAGAVRMLIDAQGDGQFYGNLTFEDNKYIAMGGGLDFKLYHDGSDSYIKDVGTGNLLIQGSDIYMGNTSSNHAFVIRNSGNVGIGTTAPAVRLQVKTTADGTLQRFSRSGICDWDVSIGHTPIISGGSSGDLEIMPQNANMGFAVGRAGQTGLNMRVRDGTLTLGKGIKFNSDTAAANELDDYEEGTWTAAMTSTNGSPLTMVARSCNYTKIGRMVYIYGVLTTTSLASASGNLRVHGLPYTAASDWDDTAGVHISQASGLNITAGQTITGWVHPNGAYFNISIWNTAVGTNYMTTGEWSANGSCFFSGQYAVV